MVALILEVFLRKEVVLVLEMPSNFHRKEPTISLRKDQTEIMGIVKNKLNYATKANIAMTFCFSFSAIINYQC